MTVCTFLRDGPQRVDSNLSDGARLRAIHSEAGMRATGTQRRAGAWGSDHKNPRSIILLRVLSDLCDS